jgi:hypothetical protein
MTVEELELLQRHPRFPKRLVALLLSELKRQRAIEEGAKGAAERGMVGLLDPGGQKVPALHRVRRPVGGEAGVTAPVDVEKLKRDLSEALVVLRQGKGYLGADALADELENLAADYRFLASEVHASAKDSAKLKAAVVKAISKLERSTSP